VSLLNINPEISGASAAHRFSARYTYLANSNIHRAEYRQPSSPHSHKRYRYTHTGACTERSRSNNRNQLTGANYNYLSGSTWTNSNEFDVTGLSYDRDGNIQALSRRFEGLKTYSYSYTSGTNRLAEVEKNSNPIGFTYDANGNVVTIGGDYGITGTTYDWRNLPDSIEKNDTTTYNYRYDHAGLRVYKQEGDNIHTLRGAFGEVLATYKNGSLDYWNIVRPDGTVIGRREGSNRLYYHRDHLGSTRAVVNASGSVVQTYDYYPFGLEMPGRSLTSGSTARERFTGHERDEEVGLDYMQARRYAPEFGRFLSVDPLADIYPGHTPYHYVLNNPLSFIDPTGEIVIKSDRVTRVTQRRAVGAQFMRFAPVTSQGVFAGTIRRGDPSFQNSAMDNVTFGFGSFLRFARAGASFIKGLTSSERIVLRTSETLISDGSSALLSGITAAAQSALIDDFNSIKGDELIFSVSTSLLTPGGNQLGILSGSGGTFLPTLLAENELGVAGIAETLQRSFGALQQVVQQFLDTGADLSNRSNERELRRLLFRKVQELNRGLDESN